MPGQPDQGSHLRLTHTYGAQERVRPRQGQGVQLSAWPSDRGREQTGLEAVLRPLKERSEHVLKDLEERTTTGLAAMDLLEAIAKEKEASVATARESTLPPRAFGVYKTLKDDGALKAAGRLALRTRAQIPPVSVGLSPLDGFADLHLGDCVRM